MNKEPPHAKLLDRDLSKCQVNSIYQKQIEDLQELTNYGSNLIMSAFNSSKKKLDDIIIIAVLLKQVVSMLDAFESLFSSSCISASQLQSRVMLEASVYIDFMLLGESEKKAECFYVANLRRELTWCLRSQKNAPERESFLSDMGEFSEAIQQVSTDNYEELKRRTEEINEHLRAAPWRATNEEFERLKKKRNREASWYAPFGQTTFRQVCKEVKRLHEYEVFYTGASEKMHAAEYRSHINILNNKIEISSIRNANDASAHLAQAFYTAYHTYTKIIQKYRPQQIQELRRRYIENWRSNYLTVAGHKNVMPTAF